MSEQPNNCTCWLSNVSCYCKGWSGYTKKPEPSCDRCGGECSADRCKWAH